MTSLSSQYVSSDKLVQRQVQYNLTYQRCCIATNLGMASCKLKIVTAVHFNLIICGNSQTPAQSCTEPAHLFQCIWVLTPRKTDSISPLKPLKAYTLEIFVIEKFLAI
jgi:hypothetical protein